MCISIVGWYLLCLVSPVSIFGVSENILFELAYLANLRWRIKAGVCCFVPRRSEWASGHEAGRWYGAKISVVIKYDKAAAGQWAAPRGTKQGLLQRINLAVARHYGLGWAAWAVLAARMKNNIIDEMIVVMTTVRAVTRPNN